MREDKVYATVLMILLVSDLFLGLTLAFAYMNLSGNTYKDGQIDAINGKIIYCLNKNDIGESIWVKCDEK